MTPQERKDQCQKIMLEHLTACGFPNLSRQEILKELPALWEKLKAAGLLLPEYEYLQFRGVALQEAVFSELTEKMEAHMGRRNDY